MSSSQPGPGPSRSTDGFSIAALVTGIAGTGPVAFALGALALHRTASRRTPGRGFAVAGMVLGGFWMLVASGAVVAVVAAGIGGAGLLRGLGGPAGTVTVDDLEAGDCFETGADDGRAGTVEQVDCARAHDGEVLEVVSLPEGPYPGEASLELWSEDRCMSDANEAVERAGLVPEDFEYGYYYPLEGNWREGSRLLQCTIHGGGGQDVRGSVLAGDATLGVG
ncbi:DUF4190 domain-containing protein [Kineococcus sp. SYSU DK002]|uniref:DUF4190 domain-containing protein n=1 Tax=Kineococcus sp. SYSU DK002 TaxID=3383123 RepID=UPI003D7C600A